LQPLTPPKFMGTTNGHHNHKVTAGTLLVTLGIIYGDIGTSPLYVFKAIIGDHPIDTDLIYGGLSCVFWTLTLQTTLKYVILTLRADNNGEGGIFSLYALVRRRGAWLYIPAMIGGATLLADGIITPPISVSSAIEGLRLVNPDLPTVPIVLAIISGLFLIQSFGTSVVGKAFGPMMLVWFLMLGTLGLLWVAREPGIFVALSPHHAYRLLVQYPGGFWILGAVFLCTTGAEALYSDLGHCGRQNIRISWGFVKTCLLLNYFGQGAWLLEHVGNKLTDLQGGNPFYALMPDWFLYIGIGIATLAAIIASQALITGSFTLISEAVRLNFWPRVKIRYPSNMKGQLYVPSVNYLLWAGCVGVVLYFRESSHMEAAYGLAITLTMLMTTLLLGNYLYRQRLSWGWLSVFLVVYLAIEGSFLLANLLKFTHGGWVSLVIGGALAFIMFVWREAGNIKRTLIEYIKLDKYVEPLKQLSADISVPKYATHLVYLTGADQKDEIERKTMYSLFEQNPKRADIYWFVHVDTTDDPYTMEYQVDELVPNDVIRVTFRLGFRVELRINYFFRKVVEDMVKAGEVDVRSRYASLREHNIMGDFQFIVIERVLSYENAFPVYDKFIMDSYFFIKQFTNAEDKWFGLDPGSVRVEKVPIVIDPVENVKLQRIASQKNVSGGRNG
jgi:KUP system potassium uptake protein